MDNDLDELKGCPDLGFGFGQDEIPELCNTLPALELYYSMTQKFLEEHQRLLEAPSDPGPATDLCSLLNGPIAKWKTSSLVILYLEMPSMKEDIDPSVVSLPPSSPLILSDVEGLPLYFVDGFTDHSYQWKSKNRQS